MGNINSSRHFLATNLVACVLISILDIRFSVAYISYFWIVLLSYLIYCVWRERDYKHLILRTCRHNWPNIKLLLLGIVIFYGLLLLSSLLLKDKVSVKTAIDWLRYTFPFFGFVFLASLCNINKGIAYGVCISVIANATFSGLQLGGIGSLLF